MCARLLVLIGAMAVVGCSSPAWVLVEPVVQTGAVRVQLERRGPDAGAAPVFAHPAEVARVQLADFFLNATYTRHGERKPVVHADRAPLLARSIAEGLAKADATTRVRFAADNPSAILGVFNAGHTSRGVAFVQPSGVLNIVFDVVDDTIDVYDDTWSDPVLEGKRAGEIRPPAGSRSHIAKNGNPDPLWIEMTLAARLAPAATAAPTKPAPDEPIVAPAAEPIPALTEKQILDRLRYLEELHERGAITTEAYRRQRKALLAPRP